MQESELLAQIAAGDTEQFGVLYDSYFPKIYNYLFYRVRSKEIAEDLASATFFKAIRHLGSFNERKGTFSAWLYRIARNTLFDHYRTHGRTSPIENAEMLADPRDIEDAAIDRELVRAVNECISRLSARQQEIIALRIRDDLPYAEIAQILGKSEASCKMEFSRAMKKLRMIAPLTLILLLLLPVLP